MAKYGKKASDKVEEKMHELKEGTLRSGGSGRRVKSREQAIAIGLSEARREGGKVPSRRTTKTRSTRKAASRSGGTRKTAVKRTRGGSASSRANSSARTSTARKGAKKR